MRKDVSKKVVVMESKNTNNIGTICRFDLDLYENDYGLPPTESCDNCREYNPCPVECPKTFIDGEHGPEPFFMCEDCCSVDFSEYPVECLTSDCEIANEKFSNIPDKESVFAAFLNELNIKNYSTEGNIFKFTENNFVFLIISLDKSHEINESLSLLEQNIELFDAQQYGSYCKALKSGSKWFGIDGHCVELARNSGLFVNECDTLNSPHYERPIIRFTSPMDIYGYTLSFFIDENSLNFVEIYPYNVESIFEKEYKIPYYSRRGWIPYVFESLEKEIEKNIHYKLVTALRIIQNRDKLKINQKIEILQNLSTYFDFAFTELCNKAFNKKVINANSSLGDLIKIGKIKSTVHTKEKLNQLKSSLTSYKEVSDFEEKLLGLIFLNEIKLNGNKEDLSNLNYHLADFLISILIRNFFAHRAVSSIALDERIYKYCKCALFSSVLSLDLLRNNLRKPK
jgi:hypothetical protein